jgi:hypothetical protein
VSQPDPSLGAENLDGEEGYEEDGAAHADGDGPAPAASLTSIRLSRRRPQRKPRSSAPAHKPGPDGRKTDTAGKTPSAAPQAEASHVSAEAQRPGTIVDYWSRLRGERSYPSPAELDSELITAAWPNAILLRRHDGESGLRAAALYKPDSDPSHHSDRTLDLSPMIVEWILSLAERTVGSGQPIAEKESFERPCGSVRYAACSLPLGESQGEVDHVLCYLRVLG